MSKKYKCRVCGREHDYVIYCKDKADICSDHCWTVDFWCKTLDDHAIIIDGNVFHIGNEQNFRGFDGKRFSIRMDNGKVIHTDNLFLNGVPSDDGLVVNDNARFINDWYNEPLCVRCGKPAYSNCYSDAGRREVDITGLCEHCFDEITKEQEDE